MDPRFLVKLIGDTENVVHSIKLVALRIERDNMGSGADTTDLAKMKMFCQEYLDIPLIQAISTEGL